MPKPSVEDEISERLPPSLEDYIETIYEIVSARKFARVRDIVKQRNVRSSSVTGALKKLEERGLIKYEKREYIVLTPRGEEEARKVLSRHDILSQFLSSVLQMPKESAEQEACAIEHYLSDDARDRLVCFIEFLESGTSTDVTKFRDDFKPFLSARIGTSGRSAVTSQAKKRPDKGKTLADLPPGHIGVVTGIEPGGAIRKRLLDMGILPKVEIAVERIAVGGDPIWIRVRGYQVSLRQSEARLVRVSSD